MPSPNVLRDVFTAHESLTPPSDAAFADLTHAIAGNCRTRRRARRTVLASGGAAVAVAAVATTVALVSGSGTQHRLVPAAHSRVPQTSGSTPTSSATRPIARPPMLPGPLSFAPGWLPGADARMTNYEIAPDEQYRGYDMTAFGSSDLYVAITLDEHMSLGGPAKRSTERNVTIDGKPAHESVQDGSYQLGVDLGSGRLLTVVIQDNANGGNGAGTGEVAAPTLTTAGRHIAADIRYDVHDAVHPPLTLTGLPQGLHISDVRLNDEINNSVEDTEAVDYTLSTEPGAKAAVYVSISRGSGTTYALPPTAPGDTGVRVPGKPAHTAPGQPVHGHPSLIIRATNAVELIVKDFAPGRELVLIGRTDTSSLADLYTIADGARFS